MTNTCLGRLLPVVALAVLATSSGCSELNNCTEGSDVPIIVEGGKTFPDSLIYESAPDDGPLTHFTPKRKLKFEHGLGIKPILIVPSLSFDKHGTDGGDVGNITLPSGNMTLLDCADSHTIVLRNDTCEEDFYVRVVAMAVAEGETDNDDCSKE